MRGLGSGGRVWVIAAGFNFLLGSAVFGCAKGSPPQPHEAAAMVAPPEPANTPAPEKVSPRPAAVQAVANAAAQETVKHTDFAVYWRELRTALLSGSADEVARFTVFPLTVRGEMDDDPVRHVERTAFPAILRQLLAQDVGLSPDPEPLSRYLGRMNTVPPGAVSGTTARVASMQFALGPDGWRLVGAYLGDG